MKKFGWVSGGLATFLLIFGTMVCGCVASAKTPQTFVNIPEVSWKSIELRSDLNYEEAWSLLVDTITKKWDIDILDAKTGYLRTTWTIESGMGMYGKAAKGQGGMWEYGKRLSAKFAPDKKTVRIKTEAYYEYWYKQYHFKYYGLDNRFNDDAYTEIAGKLGRTTR